MQKLYMNPKINAALDTKVRTPSPELLKKPQLQTRSNRFGLAEGTPYRNTIAHVTVSDTTATTAIESQMEEEEKLPPGITEEEDILRLESQLSKISINSYKEDEEGEKEKDSPRFMMQDAFVDYVTKRDNLKLDLDKQESNFHMRLLKRRMTSANRSCNRSRSSFSQQKSPKAAPQKSLKSVTSFTNLFFGHRSTPYREKVSRGRSLKPPQEDLVSKSLDVEEKKLQNLSISIKDITFVTQESPERNVVNEKDEFSDSNFSLDSMNNDAPGHGDVSWLSSEIEKNQSAQISGLSDIKEDVPTLQFLLSDKKETLEVEEEKKVNIISPRIGPFHPNRPLVASEQSLHKKAIRHSLQSKLNKKSPNEGGKTRGFRASERVERKKRMNEREK